MTFDVHQLDTFVLVGAGVTLLAILAVRLSTRAGLPSLLIYLLMGVVLGESVIGIHFENAELAHALGFGALALILAEGGLTTSWFEVRPSVRLGVSLATLGVGVSVGIVAVGAHLLLGLSWQLSVLLGAVTSPTDAAAVFSVLRGLPLSRRLVGSLEVESGLNDAPTVVLVTLISTGAVADRGVAATVLVIVFELVAGALVGLGVGFSGAWLMRRAALPSSGLYPLAVLSLSLLAYGAATGLRASGFAAIYVAALVLGNSQLPHRAATRSFAEGVAWLAQIGLFVMLGLLLSPGRVTAGVVGIAVVGSLLLTLVARPLTVLVSSVVQPMPLREVAFVSWAGLRGAVPIVLATIPLAEGVTDAARLFDIVFVIVVISTLLTGPTLPMVAKRLRVTRRSEPRQLEFEVAPLERVAADLLQVTVSPVSLLHGVEVGELRLPAGSSVSMVVREGLAIVPERRTVLRHGDDLLIVTPRGQRERTVQRLRTVSAHGRLGRWLDDG
ncbi:MAG: potassium/proton antiporter [Nocardioides sp.]